MHHRSLNARHKVWRHLARNNTECHRGCWPAPSCSWGQWTGRSPQVWFVLTSSWTHSVRRGGIQNCAHIRHLRSYPYHKQKKIVMELTWKGCVITTKMFCSQNDCFSVSSQNNGWGAQLWKTVPVFGPQKIILRHKNPICLIMQKNTKIWSVRGI